MPTQATARKCPACETKLKAADNGITVCPHCDRSHELPCETCKTLRGYNGTGPKSG